MEGSKPCQCGHSAEAHIYPGSALYGDCLECRCELYNPPDGLKGVPLHPLFAFTEDEYRFVSCSQCRRFKVLPDGICESCWWDNDNNGMVQRTRPEYCFHSPTRKHQIPDVTPFPDVTRSLKASYCEYCLRTIRPEGVKRKEHVMRYWSPKVAESRRCKRKDKPSSLSQHDEWRDSNK